MARRPPGPCPMNSDPIGLPCAGLSTAPASATLQNLTLFPKRRHRAPLRSLFCTKLGAHPLSGSCQPSLGGEVSGSSSSRAGEMPTEAAGHHYQPAHAELHHCSLHTTAPATNVWGRQIICFLSSPGGSAEVLLPQMQEALAVVVHQGHFQGDTKGQQE